VLAQTHDYAEETDKGPAEARRRHARLCLVSGEVKPTEDLIRYVVGPDGTIVPDIACKLPGRGAWISANRSVLDLAIEQNLFARAFRGKGVANRALPDLVERLLLKSALEALSLANKAGQVITGFEKIKTAFAGGKTLILMDASDAARDGARKLDAILESRDLTQSAKIKLFSREQLDLALGRSNVVHAALLDHPASRVFLANCLRYERWRDDKPPANTAASTRN
jgi:uncharacterized protein